MEESLELKEIRWSTDLPQPLTFFMMMNSWIVRIKRKCFWIIVLEKRMVKKWRREWVSCWLVECARV